MSDVFEDAVWHRSEIVEWRFEDEEDIDAYERWRRPLLRDAAVGLPIMACIFGALSWMHGWQGFEWLFVLGPLALLFMPALRYYLRTDYGLRGVRIVFSDGSFDFSELFGRKEFPVRIARVPATCVRSALWGSDGLLLRIRPCFGGGATICYRLLFAGDGIGVAGGWCAAHGIKVDGVPPLPGGYVRPAEERRGL